MAPPKGDRVGGEGFQGFDSKIGIDPRQSSTAVSVTLTTKSSATQSLVSSVSSWSNRLAWCRRSSWSSGLDRPVHRVAANCWLSLGCSHIAQRTKWATSDRWLTSLPASSPRDRLGETWPGEPAGDAANQVARSPCEPVPDHINLAVGGGCALIPVSESTEQLRP